METDGCGCGSSSTSPFTTELRRATKSSHALSDRLVNSKLVFALQDETVWVDALLIFYEIFKCLEQYKQEMDMPEMNQLYVDEILLRTAAFEKDLQRYLGQDWKNTYVIRREVVEYLQHLQELREERPLLLLAYVYHLYMGLLSGGQIIRTKKQLRKIPMALFTNPGYYLPESKIDWVMEFSNSNIGGLKKSMKAAMNDIASKLTQEQRYALINESQMVFINNNNVIKTVRGTNKAILWKLFYVLSAVTIIIPFSVYTLNLIYKLFL